MNVSACIFFDITKSLISWNIYTKNNIILEQKCNSNIWQAWKASHQLMHILGKGPYQAETHSDERTVTNFSFEIVEDNLVNLHKNAFLTVIPDYRKYKYQNKISNFEQPLLFLPI